MKHPANSSVHLVALCTLAFAGCAKQADSTPRPDLSPLARTAQVSRLAPDFTFSGASARSLRALRGQAVVLVIADSPRTGDFRRQMARLEEDYSEFASRQTVFVAAFRNGEGPVRTNVPFAIATNGPAVAASYGLGNDRFAIAVIGKDGNLDYVTDKVLPGERVRDVIQNSYAVQNGNRQKDAGLGASN